MVRRLRLLHRKSMSVQLDQDLYHACRIPAFRRLEPFKSSA